MSDKNGITNVTAFRVNDDGTKEDIADFALEPPSAPGHIPERVILELRQACSVAADYAGAFTDACNAQAEKHGIKPGALKKYIKALENDKLDDAEKEAEDLQALIESGRTPA